MLEQCVDYEERIENEEDSRNSRSGGMRRRVQPPAGQKRSVGNANLLFILKRCVSSISGGAGGEVTPKKKKKEKRNPCCP